MEMKWTLCSTRTELPTIKVIDGEKSFYLHSRYDPLKEAARWVDNLQIDKSTPPSSFVIVGMGAGYHVWLLHQIFPEAQLHIWEFNSEYARWIKNTGLLNWMEPNKSKIIYNGTESLPLIRNKFLPFLQGHDSLLLLHPPSLQIIPADLYELRNLLEDYLIIRRSAQSNRQLLYDNYSQNLTLGDPGISQWLGQYNGRPMILVSAGPSLNKQLLFLNEIRKSNLIIIGSVGTALAPLHEAGIKPDFIMLSDPQINILEQINKFNIYDLPLFYLCTANTQTVQYYQGPRYIVWQKGFPEAEMQATARCEPLIQTGGSVATCLLDLMVQMGGCPIALVCQDLAYTNGRSHADNTHAVRAVDHGTSLLQTEDFFMQGKVSTSRNLYSYLRWFERYVRDANNNGRFWNCTEGGAYIKGWIHCTLSDFFQRFA